MNTTFFKVLLNDILTPWWLMLVLSISMAVMGFVTWNITSEGIFLFVGFAFLMSLICLLISFHNYRHHRARNRNGEHSDIDFSTWS